MPPHSQTTPLQRSGSEGQPAPAANPRENVLDPPAPQPARRGLRYGVSAPVLGKLERLAQSHWEINELQAFTREELTRWDPGNPLTVWNVVQTVHASSQIEGEGITAERVPLLFHALTRTNGGALDLERDERGRAYEAIGEAYFWAINGDRRPLLSLEFILELHTRMFATSKPGLAGRLKRKPVVITDTEGNFRVRTLPVEKTKEYLSALCERTNGALYNARQFAAGSKLLAMAEFVLDFLAIHPFEDGNGRTARLLSTYLLHWAGYFFPLFYPLDSVVLETRREYYHALFESQRRWYQPDEDLTPWVDYYVGSVFRQWERAFSVLRDRVMAAQAGEAADPPGAV